MIDVVVPAEQEGTQAVVRAWLKQVGDRVEVNDPLVELETDKVAMEVPAPAAGVLREILLDTDAKAEPGAILGRIAPVMDVPSEEFVRPERIKGEPPKAPGAARRPALDPELRLSPAVKRALLQHDIDPAKIPGTGRDGRITRADVDRAVEDATRVQTEGPRTTAQPRVAQPSDASIRSHSIPHDRMRLKIAENMLASVTQAPHVTAMFEADFSAIMRHRERHKDAFAKKGVKLSYTAYFVAAAA